MLITPENKILLPNYSFEAENKKNIRQNQEGFLIEKNEIKPVVFSRASLGIGKHRLAFGVRCENGEFSQEEFEKTLNDKRYFTHSPDKYQIKAAKSIMLGNNLIVLAPTGTGKTQIAEYAIRTILDTPNKGKRVFYTSPLKALSIDHYKHFQELYGKENVGLIIGDRQENTKAPLLVMTTEVYRNMASNLKGAHNLYNVDTVIFDEFHFMSDKQRGRVWEESIMLAPKNHWRLNLIALSATMGNPQELKNWFQQVREANPTTDIVDVPPADRHVPLEYFLISNPSSGSYNSLSKLVNREILSKKTLKHLEEDTLSQDEKFSLQSFANFLKKNQDKISQDILALEKDSSFSKEKIIQDIVLTEKSGIITKNIEALKNKNLVTKDKEASAIETPEFKMLFKTFVEVKKPLKSIIGSFAMKDISVSPLTEQSVNFKNLSIAAAKNELSEVQKKELTSFYNHIAELKPKMQKELDYRKRTADKQELLLGIYKTEKIKEQDDTPENLSKKIDQKVFYMQEKIKTYESEPDEQQRKAHQHSIDSMQKDIAQIREAQKIIPEIDNPVPKPFRQKVIDSWRENTSKVGTMSYLVGMEDELSGKTEKVAELKLNIQETNLQKEKLEEKLQAIKEFKEIYKKKKLERNLKGLYFSNFEQQMVETPEEKVIFKKAFGDLSKITCAKQKPAMEFINAYEKTTTKKFNAIKESIKFSEDYIANYDVVVNPNKIALALLAKITNPTTKISTDRELNLSNELSKTDLEGFASRVANAAKMDKTSARRLGLILSSKEPKLSAIKAHPESSFNIRPYQVVENLFQKEKEGKDEFFPMIYFIFSKAECNRNLDYFIDNKKSLLTPENTKVVNKEIEQFFKENPYIQEQYLKEKNALYLKKQKEANGNGNGNGTNGHNGNFNTVKYIEALRLGVGVHHSGLLPPMKGLQEKLFGAKLTKVVFSTETIAAGLNFPAKTVVIDSLKQPYDDFAVISANKFHQMGGRAGRRGKDPIGKVLIVNNVENTADLAINLVKAPPDKLNSQYKLDYSSVLCMLNNKTYEEAEETFNKSFLVFQNKTPIISGATRNKDRVVENLITKKMTKSYHLIENGYGIFKKKTNTFEPSAKLKLQATEKYDQLNNDVFASVDRGASNFTTFLKVQKFILRSFSNNLGIYDYLQEPFVVNRPENSENIEDDDAEKKERLLKSKENLKTDIKDAIDITSSLLKIRSEYYKSKRDPMVPPERIAKLREESEEKYQKAFANNILTPALPHTEDDIKERAELILKKSFLRPEFLRYRLKVLEKLDHYVDNPEELEHAEFEKENSRKRKEQLTDDLKARLNVLKTAPSKLGALGFDKEKFVEKSNQYRLTEKGVIAAQINGVNQVFATEMIYGKNALFNKLSPREIVAITGCLISGFDENRYGKLNSEAPDNDPLTDKIYSTYQTLEEKKEKLDEFEFKLGVKDSDIRLNHNLASAFYAYSNPETNFNDVFKHCIDKSQVAGYMEGDFATHILETIDLLQQMRDAVGNTNPDLKLKLQISIDLLNKQPITEMIKKDPDSNHDLAANLQLPMDGNHYRKEYKNNVNSKQVDDMFDCSSVPNSRPVREYLKRFIMTSPASLEQYSNALNHIYSPEVLSQVSGKYKTIKEYVRLSREEHKTNEEIAALWGVDSQILAQRYADYAVEAKSVDNIPRFVLGDCGFVFEQVAFNETKGYFSQVGLDLLNKKHPELKADKEYAKKNFIIANGIELYAKGQESPIGEADVLVYDKNIKKVVAIGEAKFSDSESVIKNGIKRRQNDIEDLIAMSASPETKINIDGEKVALPERTFDLRPKVVGIIPKGYRYKNIENTSDLPVRYCAFDRYDIKAMSETLIHHIYATF